MEGIVICKGKFPPTRVIKDKDTLYFYWPWEIGIKKHSDSFIKSLSIVQSDDYEPIRKIKIDSKDTILTRYHNDILIYFNNPFYKNNNIVINFFIIGNSPYVLTNHSNSNHFLPTGSEFNKFKPGKHKPARLRLLSYLYKLVIQTSNNLNCPTSDFSVENKEADHEYKFENYSNFGGLVWVGIKPNHTELSFLGF